MPIYMMEESQVFHILIESMLDYFKLFDKLLLT